MQRMLDVVIVHSAELVDKGRTLDNGRVRLIGDPDSLRVAS